MLRQETNRLHASGLGECAVQSNKLSLGVWVLQQAPAAYLLGLVFMIAFWAILLSYFFSHSLVARQHVSL